MNIIHQRFEIIFVLVILQRIECTDTNTAVDTNADAKAIVDSKFDPKVVASILPFRKPEDCIKINQQISQMYQNTGLLALKYTPLENQPYDDLIFALVSDSMTVFSMYMGQYLHRKAAPFITMVLVQVPDIERFKEVYNSQHTSSIDVGRKKQKGRFKDLLAFWLEKNRVKDEDSWMNDAWAEGQRLYDEQPTWNQEIGSLEYVLIEQSFAYGREAIRCYENKNAAPTIEDDINTTIKNPDVADAFSSLARFVKDGYKYLAQILHDHCNGADNWAIWIIVVTTSRGYSIKAIDTAFQSLYQNVTLKDYILQTNAPGPIFKEMLAVLVDPSYKPSYMQSAPAPGPSPGC